MSSNGFAIGVLLVADGNARMVAALWGLVHQGLLMH